MPGGDRTGPAGMGPKTGRGVGYCSGSENPGWTNDEPGRGAGYGNGRGGGRAERFGRGGRSGVGRGGRRRRRFLPLAQRADRTTARPATAQALGDRLQRLQAELSELSDRFRSLVSTKPGVEEEK